MRLRLAHVGAQLKVENPVPLRTIWNFDFLPSPRASYCCGATLIYPDRWRHEHCTQKERPAPEGRGFIDENGGGGPGVRLRKRQHRKVKKERYPATEL
jgi:hypothetical protein